MYSPGTCYFPVKEGGIRLADYAVRHGAGRYRHIPLALPAQTPLTGVRTSRGAEEERRLITGLTAPTVHRLRCQLARPRSRGQPIPAKNGDGEQQGQWIIQALNS
jgi:hypothetical protein